MKVCPKCKETKELDQFGKDKTKPSGLKTYCKSCHNDMNAKWKRDTGRVKGTNYHRNKPVELQFSSKKEYDQWYFQTNKAKFAAKCAARKAMKLRATPSWADLADIERIYQQCPEGHHVDHTIPLQGKYVCGLHVSANLQYLPAAENIRKGNKWEP